MSDDMREVSVKGDEPVQLLGFHPDTGDPLRVTVTPGERCALPSWMVDTLSRDEFTIHQTKRVVEEAEENEPEDVELGVEDNDEPVVETADE